MLFLEITTTTKGGAKVRLTFIEIIVILVGLNRTTGIRSSLWLGQLVCKIVFIDTVLLVPDFTETLLQHWMASGHGNQSLLDSFEKDKAKTMKMSEDQWAWINETLRTSTADWLFVAGHYPCYSGGEHGSDSGLDQKLVPLLESYHVDAYFSGHDHTVQHLQSNQIDYYVSGSGSKTGEYTPIPQSLFGSTTYGFMLYELNELQMDVSVLDYRGELLYSYTQPKKNKRTM